MWFHIRLRGEVMAQNVQSVRSGPGKRYCAFIDLLGIREMAGVDPEKYKGIVESFHERLADLSVMLKDCSGNIYAFSDCAFIETDSVQSLLEYLQELRHWLLT